MSLKSSIKQIIPNSLYDKYTIIPIIAEIIVGFTKWLFIFSFNFISLFK